MQITSRFSLLARSLVAAAAFAVVAASAPAAGAQTAPPAPAVTTAAEAAPVVYRGVLLPAQAAEHTGAPAYNRDAWSHWDDLSSPRDCEHARYEVLRWEARAVPSPTTCNTAFNGTWFDPYTRTDYTGTSTGLDVDHRIALAEAHGSGGWAWTAARRQRYANFLDGGEHLVAVAASVNRSKSDKDPGEWLPPSTAPIARCEYGRYWAHVKVRWGLTADSRELTAIRGLLDQCRTTFTDVPTGARGHTAITWAAGNGVLGGNTAGRWNPTGPINRQAAAVAIWRAWQSPQIEQILPYSDVTVAPGRPGYQAIGWNRQLGALRGNNNGTFSPTDRTSRASFIYALWRLNGAPTNHPTSAAADVPAGAWYADAVDWAIDTRLASLSNQRFNPDNDLIRRTAANWLHRTAANRFVATN